MKILVIIFIIIFNHQFYSKNVINHFTQKTNYFSIQDSLNTNAVSGGEISDKKIIVENPFYYELNKYLPHEFFFPGLYNNFSYSENFLTEKEINDASLHLSKLQLNKAMQMNYNLMKKNELGTFGKILGAAVGATAVGLGVYHIIKYKDDYFK